MEKTRSVTTPLYVCDAFAADRFKGNQAAVVMVPTSVYLMDWSSVSSLEASFGRGEPEESEKTEEEKEEEAQAYADDRHLKMGRSFQNIAREMNLSETAFIYRLPASRVRAIQDEIHKKSEEFESEYEAKVKEDEMNQMMGGEDANAAEAASNPTATTNPGHVDPSSPGLIPSTSFSMGDFGASFLDVRSMSMTGSVNAARKNRPRRLHTQWFGMRWFTPEMEVKLCGHATVAAAHTIFETSRLCHYQSSRHLVDNVPVEFFIPAQTDVLCFVTASGIITVKRKGDNESSYALNRDSTTAVESYEVHFPSTEAKPIDDDHLPPEFKQQLLEALNLPYSAEEAAGEVAVSTKNGYYVLELKNPIYVPQCKPNESALRAAFTSEAFKEARKKHGLQLPMPHGLAVVADNAKRQLHSGEAGNADVVTRFFAPWMGVQEDPVTGSLYTTILGYWLRRRQDGHYKVGDRLQFYQASSRGGSTQAIIIGKKAERIALVGSAVTFLRGSCTYNVED